MPIYRDMSRRVWATIRELAPVVEQTGIDEGYLDLTEQAADFLAARALAEAIQTAVRGTTGSRARSASRARRSSRRSRATNASPGA